MLKIRGMSISGNLLMGVNRFGHGTNEKLSRSDPVGRDGLRNYFI